MLKTLVYIDGFNLYYGSLKGGPDRWLDLEGLFRKMRPHDDLQRIWYFTALVDHRDKQKRQRAYLEALASTPIVKVQYGLYEEKTVKCNVRGCGFTGDRKFSVPEEKKTDVNIALQMLDDAYQGVAERMVVVSGDSDLVPAARLVKKRAPSIDVVVYVPARDRRRGAAKELRRSADKHRTLPQQLLPRAQFPSDVTTPSGAIVSRPSSW